MGVAEAWSLLAGTLANAAKAGGLLVPVFGKIEFRLVRVSFYHIEAPSNFFAIVTGRDGNETNMLPLFSWLVPIVRRVPRVWRIPNAYPREQADYDVRYTQGTGLDR